MNCFNSQKSVILKFIAIGINLKWQKQLYEGRMQELTLIGKVATAFNLGEEMKMSIVVVDTCATHGLFKTITLHFPHVYILPE